MKGCTSNGLTIAMHMNSAAASELVLRKRKEIKVKELLKEDSVTMLGTLPKQTELTPKRWRLFQLQLRGYCNNRHFVLQIVYKKSHGDAWRLWMPTLESWGKRGEEYVIVGPPQRRGL